MQGRAPLSLVFAVLALCMFLPQSGMTQDGPLRQRLKERLKQRKAEAGERIAQPGDYRFTLRHDGLQRSYRVHVPARYDAAQPAPLLVALHGGGGNMDYQADDARYGLIAKSEQEGFIAVFPNGYSKRRGGRFATWNAGRCCGDARDEGVDDVGFIRRMVGEIEGKLNVDRRRIYATGMSNGAMMSYRLACELPDVFSGIAAVAGTDNTQACAPGKPVPVLHIHARNDDRVLFDGGAGPGLRDASTVTGFASVPATIARWAALDGCSAPPRRILDRPGAYCELYAPCAGKAEVQLCVTESGGHSWPGAGKTRGEPASQAIAANDVMWEFFTRR